MPGSVGPMPNQVADGVWVRQSEWVSSNAVVVRGEGGLILVDPGIDGSDLNQLADDLDGLGIPVLAADHAYIDALRRGEEPVDARLGPAAEWLSGPHRSNLEQARAR
jgi:glyoxylase-like metal-dependent hydrolase (beta-lactamase superfamily II)